MSNLIRFEFYNNFDIWYDLYQENGGDPNFFTNTIMYANKQEDKVLWGYETLCGYGRGDIFGNGNNHENMYMKGYGNGGVYEYKYGNEFGDEHLYGHGYGIVYEIEYGILFKCGNGSF